MTAKPLGQFLFCGEHHVLGRAKSPEPKVSLPSLPSLERQQAASAARLSQPVRHVKSTPVLPRVPDCLPLLPTKESPKAPKKAQRAAPPPKEVKPLPRQVPHRKDRERRGPVSQSKVGSVKDKQDEVHKKPKVTKSGQTKTSVDRAPKPRPELREASEAWAKGVLESAKEVLQALSSDDVLDAPSLRASKADAQRKAPVEKAHDVDDVLPEQAALEAHDVDDLLPEQTALEAQPNEDVPAEEVSEAHDVDDVLPEQTALEAQPNEDVPAEEVSEAHDVDDVLPEQTALEAQVIPDVGQAEEAPEAGEDLPTEVFEASLTVLAADHSEVQAEASPGPSPQDDTYDEDEFYEDSFASESEKSPGDEVGESGSVAATAESYATPSVGTEAASESLPVSARDSSST